MRPSASPTDRYAKTSHKGGFGSSFIVTGSALKPSGLGGFANARLDLFGPDLHAFMKRAAHRLTRINSNAHDMDDWARAQVVCVASRRWRAQDRDPRDDRD